MRKLIAFVLCGLALGVFLYFVFSGQLILPQYFSLGPVAIHYYGIIMALAVASAFYLAIKRAPAFGIDSKQAEDILFWIIIGGFIGARLYHVASSYAYYAAHPADIVKVWNGGLSIYGAVIGGLLTVCIFVGAGFSRPLGKTGGQARPLLDWLMPSLIVGQIIGRFGNLFNYEAFGYPTNLPWKMFVPWQFRPDSYQQFNFFHPFFLYEALGNIIILFFLMVILKPCFAKATPGKLFFSYVLLYNLLRFGLEFLRIDSTFIGLFRLNALVSLGLVIVSAGCLVFLKKYDKTS